MNYNYFDAHGEQIGEYFLTVSVQDLKDMSRNMEKKVVLVAGGIALIGPLRRLFGADIARSLREV